MKKCKYCGDDGTGLPCSHCITQQEWECHLAEKIFMNTQNKQPIIDKATMAMLTNMSLALTEAMRLINAPPERLRQLESGDIAELYFWMKSQKSIPDLKSVMDSEYRRGCDNALDSASLVVLDYKWQKGSSNFNQGFMAGKILSMKSKTPAEPSNEKS